MKVRRHLQQKGVRLLKRRHLQKLSGAKQKSLGKGTYGSCYLVVEPTTHKPLVVKTFTRNALKDLVTEATTLQQLRLPGVQRSLGVCLETRQLVTRFAGNTADQYFDSRPSLPDALSVFLQIARALRRINRNHFAHNDLKGNNICVRVGKKGPVATIIDLGLARPAGTEKFYAKTRFTERFPWLAPELLQHTGHCCEASDVYGLAHFIQHEL